MVTVAPRRGAQGLEITARAGLGHADGGNGVAAGHARQPVAALGVGAIVQQVGRHDVVVHLQPTHKAAIAAARQHFDHGKGKVHRCTRAAPGLGHVGAQKALRAHARKQAARHLACAFPVAVVRFDLGVAKALQRFGEKRQVGAGVVAQVVVGQHGGIGSGEAG